MKQTGEQATIVPLFYYTEAKSFSYFHDAL